MSDAVRPKAVVLSCVGGAQGDLSIVRTLGREGVPVVVFAEYEDSISRYSRYTGAFHRVPSIAGDYPKIKESLIRFAREQPCKPVLFPTADPDLKMMSDLRDDLSQYYHLFVSRKEIIDGFMDKGAFSDYAERYAFPVPLTRIPEHRDHVREIGRDVAYPVIVKPAYPHSWIDPRIQKRVNQKKAVLVHSAEELLGLYDDIAAHNRDMVIQEYIPGRDDHLYSLHVYLDKESEPLGAFTGQKIRTYPVYAGIGCFVRSVYVPEIIESGVKMLQSVGYTGLALMQFKKDPRDGMYKLIEVNPRTSSWNLLAAECGVNLPYVAYRDAIGEAVEAQPRQREGVKYVYCEHDVRAFLDYRKDGELTLWDWLRSFSGPKVYQFWAADDPGPFWHSTRVLLGKALRKVWGLAWKSVRKPASGGAPPAGDARNEESLP